MRSTNVERMGADDTGRSVARDNTVIRPSASLTNDAPAPRAGCFRVLPDHFPGLTCRSNQFLINMECERSGDSSAGSGALRLHLA